MNTYEELKAFAETIKKDLESKGENVGILTQLIALFDRYIELPDKFLPDPKANAYFFEDFSIDINQCLAKQTYFVNQEVGIFFNNLVQRINFQALALNFTSFH